MVPMTYLGMAAWNANIANILRGQEEETLGTPDAENLDMHV